MSISKEAKLIVQSEWDKMEQFIADTEESIGAARAFIQAKKGAQQCELCPDGELDYVLPNGLCGYHNYFWVKNDDGTLEKRTKENS